MTGPSVPILHEDASIVVVAKPSGMIVHRGWARDDVDVLRTVRDQVGEWVYPVHRLDRGTSGVLLFARDPETCAALQREHAEGGWHRSYLALVRGHLREPVVLDHPVPRGEDGERVPAVTAFTPLGSSLHDRCSLVLARPQTGRLHQIRRHLKHLSHPIVGDVRYGKGEINRHYRARWNLHRLALHALRLELRHPRTGAELRFEAPIPDELFGALDGLGLSRAHIDREV